ncbi:MAG TPA: hypothetical protein VMT66_05870 [Steroidobacteraceae bacterium]|nr:hypothetical protein [Steroidobacteraceae bacterium]
MRLTLICSSDIPDFDFWAQVMMVLPAGARLRLVLMPLNSPGYRRTTIPAAVSATRI